MQTPSYPSDNIHVQNRDHKQLYPFKSEDQSQNIEEKYAKEHEKTSGDKLQKAVRMIV